MVTDAEGLVFRGSAKRPSQGGAVPALSSSWGFFLFMRTVHTLCYRTTFDVVIRGRGGVYLGVSPTSLIPREMSLLKQNPLTQNHQFRHGNTWEGTYF